MRRPELEVAPRVFRRSRDHAECLDTECLQLALERAELDDLTPAERAPQAQHQREQHGAAAAVTVERNGLGPGDRRQ